MRLLFTNDGDLAHRLTHPSYGVSKTYLCQVPGPVPKRVGRQLRSGVMLSDGPAKVDSFRVVDAVGRAALVEVVLHEGRKHIVRRLLAEVGLPVARLIRTAIGSVRLGNLPGHTRRLTRQRFRRCSRWRTACRPAVTGAGPGRPRRRPAGTGMMEVCGWWSNGAWWRSRPLRIR